MPENQLTEPDPQPNWLSEDKEAASNGIPASGFLEIHVSEPTLEGLRLDLSGTEGFVIGRSDNKSSYKPDVDLAIYQALEKGVSRRHAAFVRYQGMLHILDLSSVNGTYLNGDRLTPEQPYPLHTGDKLTLGELPLHLSLPTP